MINSVINKACFSIISYYMINRFCTSFFSVYIFTRNFLTIEVQSGPFNSSLNTWEFFDDLARVTDSKVDLTLAANGTV